MKCSKAKKWISRYVDGNLEAHRKSALEEHLEDCQDCRDVLRDFKSIAKRAAGLGEILPRDIVWQRIQAEMREKKQPVKARLPRWGDLLVFRPAFPRYAVSTAVVLALIVCLAVLVPKFWDRGKILTGPEFALSKLEEAEYHYQKAIEALLEAASDQKQEFDPKTAEIIKKNLELIDSSIASCRQVILNDPESVESRKYLITVLQRKTELIDLMIDFSMAPSYIKETRNHTF